MEGSCTGLLRQVELPPLLWLHRWQARENASTTSLLQSLPQLQRPSLNQHASAGRCIYVDVGAHGADSDAGIFRECGLYHDLKSDKAGLPTSEPLPGGNTDVPYFLWVTM